MVRSIKPRGAFVSDVFFRGVLGSLVEEGPRCTLYFLHGFLPADVICVGRLGSSYVGHNPDVVHVILDVG